MILTNSDFFSRLSIVGVDGFTTEEQLLSATCSLGMDQVMEIEFELHDPDWKYFRSFGPKGPNGRDATYGDMKLVVYSSSFDPGPTGIGGSKFRLQPRGIKRLREIRGPLTRNDISASQYVKDAAWHAGMNAVVQDSAIRPFISRDLEEGNSTGDSKHEWSTVTRLADEEGYVIYECLNTLYFGKPWWLYDTQRRHVAGLGTAVRNEDQLLNLPSAEMSSSDDTPDEITIDLPRRRATDILPGHSLELRGVPIFDTYKLLITRVEYPLAGTGEVKVTAKRPWNIVPWANRSEQFQ